MTHDDLVHASLGWLRHVKQCGCVFSEKSGNGRERPDAIGYGMSGVVRMVEAKASLRDAQMNRRKLHHWHGGLGHARYLAIPRDLAPAIAGDPTCALIYHKWGVVTFTSRRYQSFDYIGRFDGTTGNQHPEYETSDDRNIAYLVRRYVECEKAARRKRAEERRVIEAARLLNSLRHGPETTERRDALHELKYAVRALDSADDRKKRGLSW